ncbi:MAG: SGNH/GDSL hydrolase family protein [Thermodesulfobacteriota bacterium]
MDRSSSTYKQFESKKGHRIFRAILAVSFFFVSMEITARIDDFAKYRAPFWEKYTADRLRSRDRNGIRHNVPGSRFEKWIINASGFRGPEIAVKKKAGIKRIVCMGTSETFGLYEPSGQEWPSQLSSLLSKYHGYEVINTAVVGLELGLYQPYIQQYIINFQPNIIILMINPFSYASGRYRREAASEQDPNHTPQQVKNRPGMDLSGVSGIIDGLRLPSKMKQTFKQLIPESVLATYQLWNMRCQVSAIETIRLKGKSPSDHASPEGLALFQARIEELINYLTENHIKVILCSYPVLIDADNIDQYPAVFWDHRRFYVELSFKGLIDASIQCNQALRIMAERHQIAFVDLDRAIPNDMDHFGDNVHYTGKGAKLVAMELERQLVSAPSM